MPTNSKRKLSDWPIRAGHQPRRESQSSATEPCRGRSAMAHGRYRFLALGL
jgi:hypothetical protein